jgi:hypothetical protein
MSLPKRNEKNSLDLTKLRIHFPNWQITRTMDQHVDEIVEKELKRAERFYVPTT